MTRKFSGFTGEMISLAVSQALGNSDLEIFVSGDGSVVARSPTNLMVGGSSLRPAEPAM